MGEALFIKEEQFVFNTTVHIFRSHFKSVCALILEVYKLHVAYYLLRPEKKMVS
jgi:hypothetical protein